MTAQRTADQPLADRTGALWKTDLQITGDSGDGADQQRAEQPGIGLAQLLPHQREQGARRE
ncbi:hypothetical protein D3C76_1357490 [compost metagenome]